MIKILYNIGILCYGFLLKLISPWHHKAKKFVNGRKDIWRDLESMHVLSSTPLAWVHCASLGEFEQARPLIEGFKQSHPDSRILLTFFSPSGYDVQKDYPLADYVSYLPLDTSANAKRFLDLTDPSLVLFVKYEFWYHFLTEVSRRKIPLFGVSVIFRPSQPYFKFYGKVFFRKILERFTFFFVQNEESGKLLEEIGLSNFEMTGDTRFDRVADIAKEVSPLPSIEKFKGDSPLLVLGSAWEKDQQLITEYIMAEATQLKVIIAPHEIHADKIDGYISLLENSKKAALKYSTIQDNTDLASMQVLIIDNIGMLTAIYQYADYAFVGGAFGDGLHNILEPATFGMPIFFGDQNYKKYQEAIDLISKKVAFAIDNYDSFEQLMRVMPLGMKAYEETKKRCKQYVLQNIGCTDKVLVKINTHLSNNYNKTSN